MPRVEPDRPVPIPPSGTISTITPEVHPMATVAEGRAPSVDHLMRTADVLAVLKVSDPAFRSWIKAGKFPPPRLRMGRSPLWDRADVEAFLRGEWKPAT